MNTHKALFTTSALLFGATVFATSALADQVIPDDLIVQGSACVGLDCVNNENFGFDTIRLKENNTRIKFDDTSTSAGFPANDWQLTANDSASGGASKFSIEDVTGAKVPFTITAGAPTNSIFVDSSGRLGLRTATPVLDVHINKGDTPAHRFEQNASGGFTAQTWDVAGNEANFFIRDVTGGSRLPFRIRPGAPTSSLDINANGNVAIGAVTANAKLEVSTSSTNSTALSLTNTAANGRIWTLFSSGGGPAGAGLFGLFDTSGGGTRFVVDATGNFGIGTATPGAQLHTTSSVRFGGIPNCATGIVSSANGTLSCLASSMRFKNLAGELPTQVALKNVMALRPQTGSYKETPDVPEHWFIAEEVAEIDPALVGFNDGKPHVVKTQNVVADLIAVVQQQQRRIDELERRIAAK